MRKVVNDISKHFLDYLKNWDYLYYIVFGGYGSGKSYTTAMKLIAKSLEEKRKILVVRAVYATHRDSTFSLLKEVLGKWGLLDVCKITKSPFSITMPNGSEFIFRGVDDPEKLKSINDISIVWVEEASEISMDAFDELKGRLRANLSLHIILTFNPVARSNWTYKHFIEHLKLDEQAIYKDKITTYKDYYIHHSTVLDNRHVPASYKDRLEGYKAYNLDLYRIAFLGYFGIVGKQVFTNVFKIDGEEARRKVERISLNYIFTGLDYGFSTSYNALTRLAVDREENALYIYAEKQEVYERELVNSQLIERLKKELHRYRYVIADNARPEITKEIRLSGIRIESCKKGQGSVLDGIAKLKNFSKIYIADDCPNIYMDFTELCHVKDKNGEYLEDKFTIDPHAVDSARYGLEPYKHAELKHGRIRKPKGY